MNGRNRNLSSRPFIKTRKLKLCHPWKLLTFRSWEWRCRPYNFIKITYDISLNSQRLTGWGWGHGSCLETIFHLLASSSCPCPHLLMEFSLPMHGWKRNSQRRWKGTYNILFDWSFLLGLYRQAKNLKLAVNNPYKRPFAGFILAFILFSVRSQENEEINSK